MRPKGSFHKRASCEKHPACCLGAPWTCPSAPPHCHQTQFSWMPEAWAPLSVATEHYRKPPATARVSEGNPLLPVSEEALTAPLMPTQHLLHVQARVPQTPLSWGRVPRTGEGPRLAQSPQPHCAPLAQPPHLGGARAGHGRRTALLTARLTPVCGVLHHEPALCLPDTARHPTAPCGPVTKCQGQR